MTSTILRTEKMSKSFSNGGVQQHVIRNLDLEIKRGDFTIIMGASGSGKSTLLYALSGMDKPSLGKVYFGEKDISGYSNDALAVFRRDLVPALRDYYNRHMLDGTFISWLAMDGEQIIGTSGMSYVEKPPYFGCPSGKMGLLSSMYTNPPYRRKGIARELLSRVIKDAKEYGCGTIQITASDMGVKLYTAFGFVHNGNFMQYKL